MHQSAEQHTVYPVNDPLPTVLCIAGSDSGGGAGIQADLKTVSANGGYAFCAISALTAQNSAGIHHIAPTELASLEAQIDAVINDYSIGAVKVGMLGNGATIELVAKKLDQLASVPVVVDPVLASTSGTALLDVEAIRVLAEQLFPRATLITPNANEASHLTGLVVQSSSQVEAAGQQLLKHGCGAILIKGGHLAGDEATDYLITKKGTQVFSNPREANKNTHGTGCTLSAAIATGLATGLGLEQAIDRAKRYVTQAIRFGLPLGSHAGPTDHFFALRNTRTEQTQD